MSDSLLNVKNVRFYNYLNYLNLHFSGYDLFLYLVFLLSVRGGQPIVFF